MNKMTLQDLKSMYPKYEHNADRATSATRKGFQHSRKPAWKPARPDMTPRQWMISRRAKSS